MILHTGSIFRESSSWSKMAGHADNSMEGAFQDKYPFMTANHSYGAP